MEQPLFDDVAIGRRLEVVRVKVMHIRTKRAMAKLLGITEDAYSLAENGEGLSRQIAMRIVLACPGISLDWLYRGDATYLPLGLARLLGEAPEPVTGHSTGRNEV